MTRREGICLACLAVTAFALRLWVAGHDDPVWPDTALYLATARAIAEHGWTAGVNPCIPPLYSLLVAPFVRLGGDPIAWGLVVSAAAGALLAVPIFLLGRRLYGPVAGWLAAGIAVLYPYQVFFSTKALTETTYGLAFWTAVLLTVWAAGRGGTWRLLLAGGAWGLAYLARIEGAFYVPLAAILVAALAPAVSFRVRAGRAALVCLGFACVAAPFVVAVRERTGGWTLSTRVDVYRRAAAAGVNLRSLLADGTDTIGDRVFRRGESLPAVLPPPDPAGNIFTRESTALRVAHGLWREFNFDFPRHHNIWMLLLAGAGLVAAPWTASRRAGEVVLVSILAATILGYAALHPHVRYLTVTEPFVILWASAGIWAASGLIRRLRPWLALALASITFILLVPDVLFPFRFGQRPEVAVYHEAARWIVEDAKARGDPRPGVVGATEVACYAGGDALLYPAGGPEAAVRFARARGARYLVVSERHRKPGTEEGAAALLDPALRPSGVEVAYRDPSGADLTILVVEAR